VVSPDVRGGEKSNDGVAVPERPPMTVDPTRARARSRPDQQNGLGSADQRAELIERLSAIREELMAEADGWQSWVTGREADRDASARNLLQYLALRRHDLRDLQDPLTALGLSSLGHSEGHVQASVDAVLNVLSVLDGRPRAGAANPAPISCASSRALLAARARALLGPAPRGRPTRIMVTMPSEAADDPHLVRAMLTARMDCVRINCAHDGPLQWRMMLHNLRLAEQQTGRRARVVVDLPGPKMRTGPLAAPVSTDDKGEYVRLAAGDRLIITRADEAAATECGPGVRARIGCSLPEAFAVTRVGHHIWLDDGKIGGVVDAAGPASIALRVTSAGVRGSKPRAGKGINLPDARLDIDLLGSHSEEALRYAAEDADIVGLSFVSRPRDVVRVSDYLNHHGRPQIGLILKIETRHAFEHLPGMLLAALGTGRPTGVMIARGDLAVECGYQRLAEVQEEIILLCLAAHLPVIWATQVLDRLAKTGRPSRAEITDAAMGVQAECVMLNKGPRILEAISTLDDILRRMDRHHHKRRPLLPRLRAAEYVRTPAR
jgi:pyruvate kinase